MPNNLFENGYDLMILELILNKKGFNEGNHDHLKSGIRWLDVVHHWKNKKVAVSKNKRVKYAKIN